MEDKFFDLYARQGCLALEVGHNSITDWGISIYDRKGKKQADYGEPIIMVQDCDRNKVFAEAYVKLADYLSKERGGY